MLEYPWGSPAATPTPDDDNDHSTPTVHHPHHPYSFPAPLYGTPTNPGPFDSIEYSRAFSAAAYPPPPISFDPAGFLIYPKPEPAFESPSNYVNPGGRIGLNLGLASGRGFSDEEFVNRLYRRPRGFDTPRCQAEGCFADLTHAKHYHRRHKVCELHSKASTVVTSGLTQRFCQQCSRFHLLSEFDNGKRSCRRRLADHNRRRRKSHQLATATQNSSCSDNPTTSIPESPSNSGAVSEMSPDSNCYNNSSAASSSVSTPSSSSMFY